MSSTVTSDQAVAAGRPTGGPAAPAGAGPTWRDRQLKLAWPALASIVAGAAALRFIALGSVSLDPFYDAAVRSMGTSWHNFFFGAFEPGGSVSIDKPPVDLWLQVASVKLLGFGSTTLKLPQALAGTLSVPLLYASVRRLFGIRTGLCAALAIAVLPIEVLTSRSDTMDAVMMALIALSLLLLVEAVHRDSTGWLLLAAVALGLAFNVKLLESLVPLPGLTLFALLALPGPWKRRLAKLLAAGAVYVAVSLSWLTATLLFPAHERPFAIGSTNGSAWNAAFVFNGYDRIAGKATVTEPSGSTPGHRRPTATQAERDQVPITPPSATRLLARIGPLSGERLGLEALIALLLGLPAFAVIARRPTTGRERVQRAAVIGLAVWLVTGIVLFSAMTRLHPRYVESFTPAVAAVAGVGIAWATTRRGRAPLVLLAVALTALVAYGAHLLYGTTAIWWAAALSALGALAIAAVREAAPPGSRLASLPGLDGGVTVLTLAAVLAIPFWASVKVIDERASTAGHVGLIRPRQLNSISTYLRAHQGRARYEVASDSATRVGSLVVKDLRPVLVLTTYNARTLTPVPKLERLIASGQVRYALLGGGCGPHTRRTDAACSAPAKWVRKHGRDVSTQAGLVRGGVLWQLSSR